MMVGDIYVGIVINIPVLMVLDILVVMGDDIYQLNQTYWFDMLFLIVFVMALKPTLALSNVDKPDQHIREQDITLFLTPYFQILRVCGSMIVKVNLMFCVRIYHKIMV